MRTYIGDTPVDTTTHHDFKNLRPKDWALKFIWMYGQFDGAHHKQWVLDQVARILNNAPVTVTEARWEDDENPENNYSEYRFHVDTSDDYELWVKSYQGDFIDGEYEYEYDQGIAP